MGGIAQMLANKRHIENARSETAKKTLQVIAIVPIVGPRSLARCTGGIVQMLINKPHIGRERKSGKR